MPDEPTQPSSILDWKFGHNEIVSLAISTPLREALDSYADANNISRMEAMRRAISQLLDLPDPGHRHRYANEEERHSARLARRAKRREARRGN